MQTPVTDVADHELIEGGKSSKKTKVTNLLSQRFAAEYPTVETAGEHRLILKLGDGRMFGVELPKPLSKDEPLPARAELQVEYLDDTGVPQGAKFLRFVP